VTLDIPQVVRDRARVAGTQWWVDDLPELVASLCEEWAITVGATLTGGTEAYVAEATTADGMPAVLKLLVPGDVVHEIAVLRHAAGEGCALLLESDADRGALLLERLGPSLDAVGLPLPARLEVLSATALQLWRPAPDLGLPTGAEKGRWLIDFITRTWRELDFPVSERTIEHAHACAERRIDAHDDERSVLVHGDLHQWNTLRTIDGTGWKLVDPDGLLAEPAYDLGIVMREDPTDGDLEERATRLASLTGVDRQAIWEWGVVERVSTGLGALAIGIHEAVAMLAAAERLALVEG